MIGIIIAIVTGLAFVAMMTWLIARGFHVDYPKGDRRDITDLGLTVTTIVSPGLLKPSELDDLAERCHEAVVAAICAWSEKPGHDTERVRRESLAELDGFCCWFVPGATFEVAWQSYKPMVKGSNAVLTQLHKPIGGGPPLALIRSDCMGSVLYNGDPVAHEALHALRRWDNLHADPSTWISAARQHGWDADATVEHKAYEKIQRRPT